MPTLQVATCDESAAQLFVLSAASGLINSQANRRVGITSWNGDNGAAYELGDYTVATTKKCRHG